MLLRRRSAIDRLAEHPDIGRPGVLPGTRELVTVNPYVIVYVVSEQAVTITRVFHGAQSR